MPPPSSLSAALREWTLSGPELVAETATSHVYRVTTAGGGRAALKLFRDNAEEERRGSRLLAWYGGCGAASVLGQSNDAVLLEWFDGPTLGDRVREAGDDAPALDALPALIATLHAARQNPSPPLQPLKDRFATLFDANEQSLPPALRPRLNRAQSLATHLLATTDTVVPLHGDLHHDNILLAPRGWLVIDPKGLLGDPAYETANLFRNPERSEALILRPGRINQLADALAAGVGLDHQRLLGWAAAHAMLSMLWTLQDPNQTLPAADMELLPTLLAAAGA